jgi:MFS transporter, SP family, arabinose:H+ symporter
VVLVGQVGSERCGKKAMRPNAHLLKSTAVAALGGLLFGFDTAVIAGTTADLTRTYHLSAGSLGLTVAIALWGTVIGAVVAGPLGERYGRRDSLRGLALLYLLSALGCAVAWNWGALVLFRFVEGLAIGGSSVLGPMYIAEIAPAPWRGRLVGAFQVNVVLGILLAYFSNYVLGTMGLGPTEWRWKLGISALPAVVFLWLLFDIPRSPRWLVKKHRIEEARAVLQRTGAADYERDLQDIIASIDLERASKEFLFTRKYRLPIFLAVSIGLFNQLAGINAILYYSNDIFARAGFNKVSADLQSVAIGTTLLVFTLLAMTVIDKMGRRKLLLVGSVGTCLCLSADSTHVGQCFHRMPGHESMGCRAGRGRT